MEIAVIGAGVIGLTSAIELLGAGHLVTIFTRELPRDTTSAVPAAIWFPYHAQPEADVHRWALATLERLRELAHEPASGVRWVDFTRVWIDSPPPIEKWATSVMPLEPHELPPGFRFGYRLPVPLMENPTYMRYLEDAFRQLGGNFELGEVSAIDALPHAVIINCSGYGARTLCGDEELRPGRGVVVLTEKTAERHLVHDEQPGTLMYVIARSKDCVLGGCDEPSDLLAVSRAEAAAIMLRCGTDARIRSVEVGIRPIRDAGVRLEAIHTGGRLFVHNYGHGGSGFTLSWGCAEEVVRLIKSVL